MASIEKRGQKSWRLVVEVGTGQDGRRKKKTKTIKVEDEALLKTTKRLNDYLNDQLHEFKREVEAGEYIKPEKMTFKDFVEQQWRPKFEKLDLAKTTQITFDQHLRIHILPYFGYMHLGSIKTMHVVDFMNYLKSPEAKGNKKNLNDGILAGSTRSYILKVLRSVFNSAVEWSFIAKNPCDGVKWPKVKRPKLQVYEEEELEEIFNTLQHEPLIWKMIIMVTFLGGFRRGEVTALELDDLNFGDDTIRIDTNIPMKVKGKFLIKDPKSESSKRTIVMPHWFMEQLSDYCKEWKKEKLKNMDKWQGGDKNYLFHTGYGIPYSPNSITNWWRKFLKKHNFRHIKLHGLRHTSATYLLENGANMKAIQERLGHADVKTTQEIYIHVTKKEEKKIIQEFDHFQGIK